MLPRSTSSARKARYCTELPLTGLRSASGLVGRPRRLGRPRVHELLALAQEHALLEALLDVAAHVRDCGQVRGFEGQRAKTLAFRIEVSELSVAALGEAEPVEGRDEVRVDGGPVAVPQQAPPLLLLQLGEDEGVAEQDAEHDARVREALRGAALLSEAELFEHLGDVGRERELVGDVPQLGREGLELARGRRE